VTYLEALRASHAELLAMMKVTARELPKIAKVDLTKVHAAIQRGEEVRNG
jgi:DNA-directed RNA polymerase subunit H (RpoH/RPB5)